MKTSLGLMFSALAFSGVALAAEKKSQDPAKLEEMTRLQILLDRANFGPGKIDGREGEFTGKALDRFRASQPGQGAQPPQAANAEPAAEAPRDEQAPAPKENQKSARTEKSTKGQLDLSGLDLQSVGEAFVQYTVTTEDVEGVGEAPKAPEALSKLKAVPYRSVLEAVAEKFHSDMDFLKEINPEAKLEALKEGDVLKVPNVEPFQLAAVKQIKPGEAFASDSAQGTDRGNGVEAKEEPKAKKDDGDDKKSSKKGEGKDDGVQLPPGLAIMINTEDKMLEVRENDRIIAAFPVTPGSDSIPTPKGDWKVQSVAKMPDFRHDEKMLKEGERGDVAHIIPPGPNNPVGVAWIALNKKGIGIHGTDDPETIGRAASHGCIRLANWDAAKLLRMVKAGVPVTIQ